jgi:hypothetical protein
MDKATGSNLLLPVRAQLKTRCELYSRAEAGGAFPYEGDSDKNLRKMAVNLPERGYGTMRDRYKPPVTSRDTRLLANAAAKCQSSQLTEGQASMLTTRGPAPHGAPHRRRAQPSAQPSLRQARDGCGVPVHSTGLHTRPPHSSSCRRLAAAASTSQVSCPARGQISCAGYRPWGPSRTARKVSAFEAPVTRKST